MKRFLSFVMIIALFLTGTITVYADEFEGDDWYVHFTRGAEMESNFSGRNRSTTDMNDILAGLQPGDNAIFHMELKNEHRESTDWYMTNEVLRSLEESSVASGGAYTYELVYTGPDGTRNVLYTSDAVGGEDNVAEDNREGLQEATSSLEEWFYVDTLKFDEKGDILLTVELEGETQGNRYQNTMAQLQMNFAVELTQQRTSRREYAPVSTGDRERILGWSSATLGLGLATMVLAVYVSRRKKGEEAEDAES